MSIKDWFKKNEKVEKIKAATETVAAKQADDYVEPECDMKQKPAHPERTVIQEIIRRIARARWVFVDQKFRPDEWECETVYKIHCSAITDCIYIKNNTMKTGKHEVIGRSIRINGNHWVKFKADSEEGKLLGQILNAAIEESARFDAERAAKKSRNYQQILNDMHSR